MLLGSGEEKKDRKKKDIPRDLEAIRIAGLITDRVNQLRGTKFGTDSADYWQTVRNVEGWLKQGKTEADFLAVVEHRYAKWGSGDMAENVSPLCLTRPRNFARYLAEVGQPTAATPAPRARRPVGEEANVQQLLIEREKSPEQREAEWQDYCRKLGVHP